MILWSLWTVRNVVSKFHPYIVSSAIAKRNLLPVKEFLGSVRVCVCVSKCVRVCCQQVCPVRVEDNTLPARMPEEREWLPEN